MTDPTVYSADQHQINLELLDPHGIEVVEGLHAAGFEAYLVGGCVRDLLLGHEPKDFDVATNATPEEVKETFRRARLVGRRFRIAHVRFGRNIIEVSTFRRGESDGIETDSDGMILRDNQYGTLEQDAFRRDFTVNALYYDPTDGRLIDYVDGMGDLKRQNLAFIGDTAVRIAEDPVRALRALRFHAKLGFELSSEIRDALEDAASRLTSVPPARLFEEFNKMFMLGYAEQSWMAVADSPICATLFPCTDPLSTIVRRAMANTDRRIAEDKPVTPGFLISVMLWEDYRARFSEFSLDNPPVESASMAEQDTLADQTDIMAIPRRFSMFAKEVWQMQGRLEQRNARGVRRTMEHKRFRAGYDLLELRALTYEEQVESYEWWKTFQEASSEEQEEMLGGLPSGGGPKKRRRRRRKKSGGAKKSAGSQPV